MWDTTTYKATNSSGLSILPSGFFRHSRGEIYEKGTGTMFWTSTIAVQTDSWRRGIWNSSISQRMQNPQAFSLSVRCVKD